MATPVRYQRTNTMTSKQFQCDTKETVALLKKLSTVVPDTSNAAEYSKFLEKTLVKARTFDKESATYVDYVGEAMNRKVKSKKQSAEATPAPSSDKKRKADDAEAKPKMAKTDSK